MKEKKNIDRLYQEKFKDFEAAPREDIWKAISAKLQEKEQKKPFIRPLWTRAAAVAAILTLIFIIGDWFSTPQTHQFVNQEKEEQKDIFQDSDTPNNISVAATNTEETFSAQTSGSKIAKGNLPVVPDTKKVSTASTLIASGLNKSPISEPHASLGLPELEHLVEEPKNKRRSIFEELATITPKEEDSNGEIRKLTISTQAAPIYYGNLGKGNFIDPQFNDNSSEGEITYSYGINVAYAVSDRIKIRSGISKVAMSYNTNGIAYHTAIDPSAISSINYNKGSDLQIIDTPAPIKGSTEPVPGAYRATVGDINSGSLNQKLGYIEVPVELQYNLIDKEFELNIIGGASTLFLDENLISINSHNLSTPLGEANNLNNISFSTNIGIGVDYNLSEKLKINLEPMFKYQLNTFNTPSVNYQPYYLGIYSGFRFKF